MLEVPRCWVPLHAGLNRNNQHPCSSPPFRHRIYGLCSISTDKAQSCPSAHTVPVTAPTAPRSGVSQSARSQVPAPTHHICVCLFKESLSEDGHNKDVNDEGDKESDAGLDEEILISFSYFPLVCTVHLPGLKRGW